MTSQEPSGAVDNDFDDAATDAEEELRKNIADFPSTIRRGDIVIDLVQGRPLYIRQEKGEAVDVFERQSFDLTTYKAHPFLPIGPHDMVFECVFVPTKPTDIPTSKKTQTYDYPRGRLARVPVEWLYGTDTHRHAEHVIETLALVIENTDAGVTRNTVVDAFDDTFGPAWVDEALELAGVSTSKFRAESKPDTTDDVQQADTDGGTDTDDADLGDFDSDFGDE
jgi:hypothetical protein